IRSSIRTSDHICDRFLKSKWVTDRQDKIPWLYLVRVSKLERPDSWIIDLEHGQVHLVIGTHQARLFRSAVAQLDFNLINRTALSVSHHVVVRNDMTLVRHDHAGAKRRLHQRFVARIAKSPLIWKEKFEGIDSIFAPDSDLR